MQDFDEKYRRMPYPSEAEEIEALRRRCLERTVCAPRRPALTLRLARIAVATAAAAVVAVCALLLSQREPDRTPLRPTFDQLLTAAPSDALQRAAAENYDDMLYNEYL